MSLFPRPPKPARRRRRTRAGVPVGPPVDPHPLVSSGGFDHRGVESCARCGLPASRTDVHTDAVVAPAVDPDVAAVSRRIVGDRE